MLPANTRPPSPKATVEVDRPPPPHAGLTRSWEGVAELALDSRSLAPDSPAHHLYPSRLVPHVPAVIDYARSSFDAGRPVLEAACDLIRLRTDSRHSRGDGRKERGAACGGIKHGSFLEVEPVLDGQVKHSVCQIGRGEIGGLVAPHLGRE